MSQKFKQSSTLSCEGMDEYHIIDGLIYKLNLLCILDNERVLLIIEAHALKIVVHFRVEKILANLHRPFFGPFNSF